MASTEPESLPASFEDETTNPFFQRLPRLKFGNRSSPFYIDLNPYVSGAAALVIWAFVAWAIIDKNNAPDEMAEWKEWVAFNFSWLYIISQDIWIAVLIYLLFSKYRHLKLGKDNEKPEFSDIAWFSMLFCCGVAVGLFYYSVAEPVWHYISGSARWNDTQMFNDNTKGEHAMMVTWYHWGLHGWIPYTTVGALIAIMAYRRDMPMTMRFCLYPLIGDKVYGVMGDFVDVLSIVCTLFGVCTSLGLGVMQINKGLVRLDQGMYRGVADHPDGRAGIKEDTDTQVAIIWCITAVATLSVMSGLTKGIKFISQWCFVLGMFLMLSVLFMGDTAYVLNLITSTLGYYIWYLPKISFHTDAFEMLADGAEAPDGRGGGRYWMDGWTIFYWGWWISWAPFVGTFMARISRGRTLGEFILGTLIIPSLYSFLWLGIFGAEGIRMERAAQNLGLTCENAWSGEADKIVRLGCLSTEDILFEQLASYGSQGFGDFLSIVALIALIFYFVTSSDSGSYVIDIIAANGMANPPLIQKIFWAFCEGAAATALLQGGGTQSLNALQTVSIVCGLPYTFILFWMAQALVIVVKEESKDIAVDRPGFKSFIFSADHAGKGISAGITQIVIATFAPFLFFGRIHANLASRMGQVSNAMVPMVVFALVWLTVIIFAVLKVEENGYLMCAGSLYMILSGFMAGQRVQVRAAIKSEKGDAITDYITCMIFYPLALVQMEAELELATKLG